MDGPLFSSIWKEVLISFHSKKEQARSKDVGCKHDVKSYSQGYSYALETTGSIKTVKGNSRGPKREKVFIHKISLTAKNQQFLT